MAAGPAAKFTQSIRNVYSSTNVTTSAWVELDAIVALDVSELEVFDSSGQTLKLGYGAAGSEVDWFHIMPGGNGRIIAILPAGVRLAVRAVSGSATTGELIINLWQ